MINELYDLCISKDNLLRAWDHVRYDSRDDFAQDPLLYDDVGANIEHIIKNIHYNLINNTYKASSLKQIDVPKSTLAVRPGTVPEVEDRIVSHAIINIIAPIIDNELSESLYSYRVKENYKSSTSGLFLSRKGHPYLTNKKLREIALIEDWFYEWPVFYEKSKYLYEKEGYSFLSISDVSSYFENIEHSLLRDQLLDFLPGNQKTINLLMEILDSWVPRCSSLTRLSRGLPIGNEVSSFLGNIYLNSLDQIINKYAISEDIQYLRYMDDVKIFSKTETNARKCLFIMNDALRDLHLNIQGSKTQIVRGEEIKELLFPKEMEEINTVINSISSGQPDEKSPEPSGQDLYDELNRILKKLIQKDKWEKSDTVQFRRILTGYRILNKPDAIEPAINCIHEYPDERMTTQIIKYFKLFPDNQIISNRVSEFILSDINQFDYQEASFILLYRYLEKIPTKLSVRLKKIIFDASYHWNNRVAAILTIGSDMLDKSYIDQLYLLYLEESNPDIKRALSTCIIQSDESSLFKFIRELKGELNYHLTTLGNFYEKSLIDNTFIKNQINTLYRIDSIDFFISHMYWLHLFRVVKKKGLIKDYNALIEKKKDGMPIERYRILLDNLIL